MLQEEPTAVTVTARVTVAGPARELATQAVADVRTPRFIPHSFRRVTTAAHILPAARVDGRAKPIQAVGPLMPYVIFTRAATGYWADLYALRERVTTSRGT